MLPSAGHAHNIIRMIGDGAQQEQQQQQTGQQGFPYSSRFTSSIPFIHLYSLRLLLLLSPRIRFMIRLWRRRKKESTLISPSRFCAKIRKIKEAELDDGGKFSILSKETPDDLFLARQNKKKAAKVC